jgi:putative transposase
MPRLLRPRLAGGVYHAYARSIRTSALFVDDDDRAMFLALLALVVVKFEWKVEAYCLMGNHYHLIVQTPHANISEGMQLLNGRYAMLFNANYGFRGHVFDGRFKCRVIGDDDDLLGVMTYVEHNPVRHGVCRRATDWPWSSARRRASSAVRAPIDLVDVIAFHAKTLDDATALLKRVVRARFAARNQRPRGP